MSPVASDAIAAFNADHLKLQEIAKILKDVFYRISFRILYRFSVYA